MATSAASSPRLAGPGARRPRPRRGDAAAPARVRRVAVLLRVAMATESPLRSSVRESPITQNAAMDSITRPAPGAARLPAQRLDSGGRAHVDQRAVLVIAVVLVLGGAGTAVQTLVAQAYGARRYRRAAQAVWTALWAMVCAAPLFVLLGAARHIILAPFGFDAAVEGLAAAFWFPRVGGACIGAAVWAMLGFYNGIGRPRTTLLISIVTTATNAALNPVFIFGLGWGIAGSAWATNVAQVTGLAFALALFLDHDYRRRYRSHLTWRLQLPRLVQQLRLGVPMGLSPAADLLGFAIFQMMQTRLGTAGGAATQIVVILTSLAYMPGFGIASAGTTLVGQSIGAGARP